MNITLKNVPAKVHQEIKREAKNQGQSLNAFIIEALKAEAERAGKQRNFPKLMKDLEKFWATLPRMDDSTELIREGRDEH